jgi:hypothetical protein
VDAEAPVSRHMIAIVMIKLRTPAPNYEERDFVFLMPGISQDINNNTYSLDMGTHCCTWTYMPADTVCEPLIRGRFSGFGTPAFT